MKPTRSAVEQKDVEAVILDLLAEVLGRTAEGLRQELARRGTHMPIDSLDAVEIIVQLEEHYGIRLDDRELGVAMRSVSALARYTVEVQAR